MEPFSEATKNSTAPGCDAGRRGALFGRAAKALTGHALGVPEGREVFIGQWRGANSDSAVLFFKGFICCVHTMANEVYFFFQRRFGCPILSFLGDITLPAIVGTWKILSRRILAKRRCLSNSASIPAKNPLSIHQLSINIRLLFPYFQQLSEYTIFTIWMFPKIGVPQNGWFIMENTIKMDDLRVPLFLETPICSKYFQFMMT